MASSALDEKFLGEKIVNLATLVVHEAADAHVSVASAESCTGGLVAGALTAVPGSSEVLLGSVVSYAISIKQKVLGVSKEIFDDPKLGAVSEPCACQMALGAQRLMGTTLAVSVTGIAGPSGAEPGKPVGTVWFGLSTPLGTRAHVMYFEGSRNEVRLQAVIHALELLRDEIVESSNSQ